MDFSKTKLNLDNIDIVIYHGGCVDGYGAALAVNQYYKRNNIVKNIIYFPGYFNSPPPNVQNKNVLICDFSYSKDITLNLISQAQNLLILDHHKSAEMNLRDIPDENKVFDMTHSGAYITWKYFFGDEEVPLLIKYIEDNDIWLKQMPYTQEVTSYIQSLPFEFTEYEKLLDENYIKNTVIPSGIGMYKQNEYYIKQAVKRATPKFVLIDNKYYFGCFLNTSVLKSEIGSKVFSEYTLCDFSAMYNINDNKPETFFSLRSEDNKADVSVIALKYGGGGHRNAAGLTVNYICNMLPCKEISGIDIYKQLSQIYFTNDFPHITLVDNIYGVHLNSSNNKYELAKYLLQVKYIDKDDNNVLQCEYIAKNKKINLDTNSEVKYSLVWSYYNNAYNYVLACIDKEIYNYFVQFLNINKFKDIIINNDTLVINYKHKTSINLDK
jgi:oligoribonuclease NrnB/cAMP/cGMP phosphodiesterase (DHH superfamily)